MAESIELKKCPFCGSRAEIREFQGLWARKGTMVCCANIGGINCRVKPQTEWYDDVRDAVLVWNCRNTN